MKNPWDEAYEVLRSSRRSLGLIKAKLDGMAVLGLPDMERMVERATQHVVEADDELTDALHEVRTWRPGDGEAEGKDDAI